MTPPFQFDVPLLADVIGQLKGLKAKASNDLAASATLFAAITHLEDYQGILAALTSRKERKDVIDMREVLRGPAETSPQRGASRHNTRGHRR